MSERSSKEFIETVERNSFELVCPIHNKIKVWFTYVIPELRVQKCPVCESEEQITGGPYEREI